MTTETRTTRSATYLLGTRRGLEACASPRGTFAVLALDHRQDPESDRRSIDGSRLGGRLL